MVGRQSTSLAKVEVESASDMCDTHLIGVNYGHFADPITVRDAMQSARVEFRARVVGARLREATGCIATALRGGSRVEARTIRLGREATWPLGRERPRPLPGLRRTVWKR